jgi:amidophosphoribosyltransferase
LNIFAEGLTKQMASIKANPDSMKEAIFTAMENVMTQCEGGYAGLYLINGVGLVGFRDPHGIRPIVFGSRLSPQVKSGTVDANGVPMTPAQMTNSHKTLDYVMASESVAIDALGFTLVR